MSWNSYIDLLVGGKHKMKGAAIHGHDGQLWATSPQFNLSVEEVKKLNADESVVFQNGVYLAGAKYVVVRHQLKDDSNPYMAVKTSGNPEGGHCMGCIYKSKQAFIIAVGDPSTQGGDVTTTVGGVYDYLIKAGY